jgi:hypothetical protein
MVYVDSPAIRWLAVSKGRLGKPFSKVNVSTNHRPTPSGQRTLRPASQPLPTKARIVTFTLLGPFEFLHDRVSGAKLSVLIAMFFFTSVISVVTGSTSLITVPVMIALGIEAHVAVATNMLALTVMSVGGSLPFIGRGVLSRNCLPASVALSSYGCWLGSSQADTVPNRLREVCGWT